MFGQARGFQGKQRMPKGDQSAFGSRRLGERDACVQIVCDALEEPGTSQSGAPNHHAVAAGVVEHAAGIFAGMHIAIADDRHLAGSVFDGGDHIPVGRAAVTLPGEARMHGDCLRAHRFGRFREGNGRDDAIFKTAADFDRHRRIDRLHHRLDHRSRRLDITQQSRPAAFLGDLGYPAAHIDINDISAMIDYDAGCFGDYQRVDAKKLRGDRAFVGPPVKAL